MDMGLQGRVSGTAVARKGLGRAVAIGPRAARFGDFAGSISAATGVKLGAVFANLTRQIPAGCGTAIAADCATARSLL